MVKALGVIMIISAGALSGVVISQRATNRILFFEQLLLFIVSMRERLNYTLEDVRRLLAGNQKMTEKLLQDIRTNIDSKGIKSASAIAVKELPNSFGLNKDDKKLVCDFFSELGTSDCDSQLSHCDLYISLIKQLLSSQKEEAMKKSKLYRLLGVFSGIGAGLFFI